MTLPFLRRAFPVACLSLALVAGLAGPGHAADVFVPGTLATTEGLVQNGNLLGSTARTVQFGIDSSLLTGLGSTITGLAFRLNGGAASSLPASTLSVTDLEIRIGTAATAISSMSTTFANNISGATLVRDGAYTLTAGTLPGNGSSPNAFATLFTFSTPYTYASGTSLVIEIRHTGFGSGTLISLDGVAAGTANSLYQGFQTNNFAGPTGSTVQFPAMTLLSASAIPEPSTYAAFAGAAVLGLAVVRRWRPSTAAVTSPPGAAG